MRIIAIVLLLAALAAGCSTASQHVATGTCNGSGVVRGTLRVVGGPPPGVDNGVAGGVVAVGKAGTRCATTSAADGSYELHLAPGVYTLRGAPHNVDGGSGCGRAGPVTLTAGSPPQTSS